MQWRRRRRAPCQKDNAYVDAGSLVSFVRGVPLQHKEDVVNSVLLAQLAANRKFNREKQVLDWYEFYGTVLEGVGWVIPAFDFRDRSDLGVEFTADKVILKLIEAIGTGNDVAIVAAAIASLQSLGGDDPAVKLFETQSHTDRAGAFQIGAAAESDGVVVLKLALTYFETNETVVRVLWFRFKSAQTKFYRGTCGYESQRQGLWSRP